MDKDERLWAVGLGLFKKTEKIGAKGLMSRCMVLLLALGLAAASSLGAEPGFRGPCLTRLASDGATVVFHTQFETGSTLLLEYPDGAWKTVETPPAIHHRYVLTDLEGDAEYSYRIIWSGEKTDRFAFRTPARGVKRFSFIAYGDSRDASASPWRHRALSANFMRHRPAFLIHTGDLLLGGTGKAAPLFGGDWTGNFFLPLQGVMERVPFYLAVGNHDQDGEGAEEALKAAFPYLAEGFHYAFDYGGAHFSVLHCSDRMGEFAAQEAWFTEDLERAQGADWRIVVLHVSPFTSGKYRDRPWTLDGRREFLRACVRNRVDLVLSGHDHSYQRFHPLKSSPEDTHAVVFIVTALAGTNPYQAVSDGYTAALRNDTDHFCLVTVDTRQLIVKALDRENRVFDEVALSREGAPSRAVSAKIWREGP